MLLSSASFLVFVPTFAESSQNSSSAMINSTDLEGLFNKANIIFMINKNTTRPYSTMTKF